MPEVRVSFPWCPAAQLARTLGISLAALAEASTGIALRFGLYTDTQIDDVCARLGRRRPELAEVRASDAGPSPKARQAKLPVPPRDQRPLRERLGLD